MQQATLKGRSYTDRLAVLLSLLLATPRNTFRAGGAHDVKYNEQNIRALGQSGVAVLISRNSLQKSSTRPDLGTGLWGSEP